MRTSDSRPPGGSQIGPFSPSRRRFVDGFLWTSIVGLGGAILYPILRFIQPPVIPETPISQVLAGTVSELSKERWKIFPFGSEPGILIERVPGDFVALTATCTHLQCIVQFEKKSGRIWCACHDGYYDLDGRVLAGPPPRPLTPYKVRLMGNDIFATRS